MSRNVAPSSGETDEPVRMLYRLRPNTVDLVCLPEMIFTGYVFPDADAISPSLEEPRTGPTSRFCAELAARLHCHVVAGYPERLPLHEVEHTELTDGRTIRRVGANAAALYGPDGNFVGEYRKTNLYDTDMTWAKPGTGFVTFHLPPPLTTLSLGICMDLNVQPPAEWAGLDTGPYEIAEYCVAQRTRVLVLLNAWLDSKEAPEEEKDWRTINYWALRLRPLWAKAIAEGWPDSDDEDQQSDDSHSAGEEAGRQPGEELLVVICNRTGTENGVTFAGSSSLFSMSRNSGRPRLVRALGRHQEAAVVWTYPKSQGSAGG
ncbi:Protein N-terminal amidase [Trametes pubescens]|uniref:Protein N-terminal amidase n=1 Tax=Trametes pubescens TaxID=154538 RepID=A0A1M2W5X3_TRAPU|nr:Protein N-terminal amidase [Trametes pubescens]